MPKDSDKGKGKGKDSDIPGRRAAAGKQVNKMLDSLRKEAREGEDKDNDNDDK